MYSTEPAGRPNVVALTFVPAVLGMFAALGWLVARISVRWGASESFLRLAPVAGLGAGGVAYYGVLSLLGPGPYHWYYVPPTTSLSMVLVIAFGAWLAWARERSNWRPVVPALALGLVGLLALGTLARDVKQGLPWRSPVISTNFATASYYARVGEGLRARIGSGTVRNSGEIGTVAFYCNCAIIDVFSHRSEFVPIAEDRIAKAGGLERLLLDLNYLWLDRNQKPLPIDYQLRYTPGPGSGRDVWQVWSQWDGVGHVTLTRLVK